ncbi:hypothetical protein N9V13_03040 [Betaproteobacteria bacterium]|nr:hypothetical protein [Betaproteobacteria bacterium]
MKKKTKVVEVNTQDVKTNPVANEVAKSIKKVKDMSLVERFNHSHDRLVTRLSPDEIAQSDELVDKYHQFAKKFALTVIELAVFMRETKQKFVNKEISENVFKVFCHKIQIKSDSSTYRKYESIANNAEKLRLYQDRLPDNYTTIYNICTLNKDEYSAFEHEILKSDVPITNSVVNKFRFGRQEKLIAQTNASIQIEKNKNDMTVFDITFLKEDYVANQEKIDGIIHELKTRYRADVVSNTEFQTAETLQKKVA